MTFAAGTHLSRYEILDLLGVGGMGEVYRARDSRLERQVAIKVLPAKFAANAEALARFRRESKAIAALSHPNIRSIYDIDTEREATFAVMELLEGETLAEALTRQSRIGWQAAVAIALDIAEGLAAAHAKGIIHRDIKPQNIFVTEDGTAKILDFGLARVDAPDDGSGYAAGLTATVTLATQPGAVMGTVQYMSPEQVRGKPADARSDIFSFGCVLYEMLTGSRIFSGQSMADTMAAILHEDPPTLAQAGVPGPPDLQRVVSHCLEKNPERRFQSARELPFALRGLLSGSGSVSPAPYDLSSAPPAAAREETPSIAVLPFVNMSSDDENEFFSDGLAEELINALSKLEGLKVASRTSAFAFKGKSQDIREIGEHLNVKTILEGSVRKSGDRLRIRAQLVNAADGYELWSETFNRQMKDVFEVQDEIAEAIAKALRVVLTEKARRALGRASTENTKAYEYYLRGRQSSYNFQRRGLERARKLFHRATELDPDYAAAYAGIADAAYGLFLWFGSLEAHKEEAARASKKALELAPDLAEAHLSRANVLTLEKRTEEAIHEFEEAIRLDPDFFDAHYFYARAWFSRGEFDKAAKYFERACEIRPEDYQSPSFLANAYEALKLTDKAFATYKKCVDASERHLELFPDDARALYLGATAKVKLGDREGGMTWVKRAIESEPEEPIVLYNVACVYAAAGEIEKSIDCLDDAVTFGIGEPGWLRHDPDLNPLRDHPRFKAILERLPS